MNIPSAISYATTSGQIITDLWPVIVIGLGVLIGFSVLKFIASQFAKK